MNLRELIQQLQNSLDKGDYPETDIESVIYYPGDDYLSVRNGPDTAFHIPMTDYAKNRFKDEFKGGD